jgi:hypothetical protein
MTISRAGRAGRAGALVAMLLTVAVAACIDGSAQPGSQIGLITGIDSGASTTGGAGASGAPGHIFQLAEIVNQGNDSSGLPYGVYYDSAVGGDSSRLINVQLDSSYLYLDTTTTGAGYLALRNVLNVTIDQRSGGNPSYPPIDITGTIPDTIYGTYTYDDSTFIVTMTFSDTAGAVSQSYQWQMVYWPNDSIVGSADLYYTDSAGAYSSNSKALMTYYTIGTLSAFTPASRVPEIVRTLRAHVADRNAATGSSALSAAGLSHHAILQIRSAVGALLNSRRVRVQPRVNSLRKR